MEMIFNNVLITQLIHITDVVRNPFPARTINSIEVPNRNGVYFQGAYFGEREITVEFHLIEDYVAMTDSDSRFNQIIRSLMYHLTTDAPAKLSFSDEPTKYYWAIVESVDLTRLFQLGEGSITFKCLDCFAYATEIKTYVQNDGILTVENYGTAVTYPIFYVTFSQAIKSFCIYTRDHIIQIGDPNATFDDTATATNKRIFYDTMYDMSNWYYGSQQLLPSVDTSGRIFDEAMTWTTSTGGEVMRPTNFTEPYEDNAGTGAYKGGMMITTFDETAEYWKCICQFDMSSRRTFSSSRNPQVAEQTGIVEFIGYDVNNTILFSMSMRDHQRKCAHNEPFFYLGSNLIWKGGGWTTNNATTKKYSKVVTNDDDIPVNAKIITDISTPTYKAKTTKSTPIYSSNSTKSTKLTTVPTGTELTIKSTKSGWYCVYTTDDKKNTGWIQTSYATKEEGESIRNVTYEVTTYGTSSGKYNDWWGRFELCRFKKGTGSLWHFCIKRIDFSTGKHTIVYEQLVDDPNNEYTTGRQFAKLGVFIGSYEDGQPLGRMSANHFVVEKYDEEYFDEGTIRIAEVGDELEINCEEHMIYKNGSEFMEYVDVGSDFIELQPFTATEVATICDDPNVTIRATVQERFV